MNLETVGSWGTVSRNAGYSSIPAETVNGGENLEKPFNSTIPGCDLETSLSLESSHTTHLLAFYTK
ncbi:uncharacterized protein N7487_011305 [Penicillium crustosum]|uniref:uncharacterized protein n=1 Tax=Penicillium crustosum TaxID=36656 RepID=UPI00239772F0|nr:uncharacterized protein N7487_011305 [Penicillium crustosum]KAJ5393664.1 hypothetical protein N7487_011305 [Penicillium crustosum]